MYIEQLYTGCLAEAAYYLESNGEAAIIDPLRDPQPYLDKAAARGATIKYILETHFHADFVSGHQELAALSGATIVFGPTAAPGYPAHIATDGEVLPLGKLTIEVLHTPGHTLESTTYLLKDEQGKDHALFTGDTLFIGDVGRPDLVQLVKSSITPEFLAGLLYDSLRHKIMPLSDDLIVYPGHGAGSACGKQMSKETEDTLGHQRQVNYALRADMTKMEFIKTVTEGLTAPPQYFPFNVLMNIQGGLPAVKDIVQQGTQPLSPTAFRDAWQSLHALVIDTRSKEAFAQRHLPGSLFIGLDDNFAPWVGILVQDLQQPILLIVSPDRIEEAVVRLSRVGYDHAIGYLDGGVDAWQAAGFDTNSLEEIDAAALAALYAVSPDVQVLDVRREQEYQTAHLRGSLSIPLESLQQRLQQLDKDTVYFIHCAGGYRSVIAASILQAHGFVHLVNIKGGFKAMTDTSLPLVFAQPQAAL